MQPEDDWIRMGDARRILGVSDSTMRKLCRQGRVKTKVDLTECGHYRSWWISRQSCIAMKEAQCLAAQRIVEAFNEAL